MPLLKCTDCRKDVSSKATACPHCGAPVTKAKSSVIRKIGFAFILLFFIRLFTTETRKTHETSERGSAREGHEVREREADEKQTRENEKRAAADAEITRIEKERQTRAESSQISKTEKLPETSGQRFAREAQEREAKEKLKQAENKKRAAAEAEITKKNEKFQKWALENTAVTDIAINGSITLFVTLKSEKYTNRDNVRLIAEHLARAYALQVGTNYAVCRVYYGNEEYAKGSFSR